MSFDGLSFPDISCRLNETYDSPANRLGIYRWVVKYSINALDLLEPFTPMLSDVGWSWNSIKVGGVNWRFWRLIGEGRGFFS